MGRYAISLLTALVLGITPVGAQESYQEQPEIIKEYEELPFAFILYTTNYCTLPCGEATQLFQDAEELSREAEIPEEYLSFEWIMVDPYDLNNPITSFPSVLELNYGTETMRMTGMDEIQYLEIIVGDIIEDYQRSHSEEIRQFHEREWIPKRTERGIQFHWEFRRGTLLE